MKASFLQPKTSIDNMMDIPMDQGNKLDPSPVKLRGFTRQHSRKAAFLRQAEVTTLEASPENIQRAKAFVQAKWSARAAEMGRPEPKDLAGACKFASLFAQQVFGGKLQGNKNHQFLVTEDGQRVDLTEGSVGSEDYSHDKRFWGNREHKESMASCLPRVEQWVSEFRAQFAFSSK